jgi:hypothetical protein
VPPAVTAELSYCMTRASPAPDIVCHSFFLVSLRICFRHFPYS